MKTKTRNRVRVCSSCSVIALMLALAQSEPLLAETPVSSGTEVATEPSQVALALSLQDLVQIALDSHPSVAAKRADLSGAQADLKGARWQYFPTPSIGRKSGKEYYSSTMAVLQQPIWTGGRLSAGVDLATAKTQSASLGILEAQFNLAMTLANTYQSWLQSQGRVQALSHSLQFHEDQAKSLRRRVEGGVSAQVDLDLVLSRLSQAQSDMDGALAASRVALSRLSQLVGFPVRPRQLQAGEAASREQIRLSMDLDSMLLVAAKHYPALRRLDADIEAAAQDVNLKQSALSPTLSVRAEHERSENLQAVFGRNQDSRVLLAFDFSPGAGLSAVTGIDTALARQNSMKETRESTFRDLVDRLSSEVEDYHAAEQRWTNLLRTRKASEGVLASYARQFEAGKRSWLDVMNAARELTQVDLSLADVEALLLASNYRQRLYVAAEPWLALPESTQENTEHGQP